MIETVRSVDGTTLVFERSGTGPPLVVVGGALNNRQSPGALVPLLAGDFTVVTYDRRGRGGSTDTPPYGVDREVEDLAALVDAVGGTALAYGHSSGAILVLEAAAAGIPLTKLAVYEPPYLTEQRDGPWEVFADKVRALADEGHRDQAVEAFIRHTGSDFDPDMPQSPWWPALTAMANTLPNDLTIARDGAVPAERLSTIGAPVLAVYGGLSAGWAEASTAAVAMAVRNGRQSLLEGQSHGVAPDAMAPLLLEFFR
ncbi:MAG: alpha/beta fold hydrolase [Actinomycetales bacterium]